MDGLKSCGACDVAKAHQDARNTDAKPMSQVQQKTLPKRSPRTKTALSLVNASGRAVVRLVVCFDWFVPLWFGIRRFSVHLALVGAGSARAYLTQTNFNGFIE